MKVAVRVGSLKPDDRFQTIHTGLKGVVIEGIDLAGNASSMKVHIIGKGRRKIHGDVKVYVEALDQ